MVEKDAQEEARRYQKSGAGASVQVAAGRLVGKTPVAEFLATVGACGSVCLRSKLLLQLKAQLRSAIFVDSSRQQLTSLMLLFACLQDVPTAYAYELEAATIVQSSQVVEAVQKVCGARTPALAAV
jgi:hypothetical protein